MLLGKFARRTCLEDATLIIGEDKIVARVPECVPAETFADGVGLEGVEGAVFVGGVVFGVWGAVGENVVFVGFLGIGVGAHLWTYSLNELLSELQFHLLYYLMWFED